MKTRETFTFACQRFIKKKKKNHRLDQESTLLKYTGDCGCFFSWLFCFNAKLTLKTIEPNWINSSDGAASGSLVLNTKGRVLGVCCRQVIASSASLATTVPKSVFGGVLAC